MANETWIERKVAPIFTHLNDERYPVEDSPRDNAIRLYRSSPSGATLQIRTHSGMGSDKTGRAGKLGKYIASVSYIGADDLRTLRDGIDAILAEIEK